VTDENLPGLTKTPPGGKAWPKSKINLEISLIRGENPPTIHHPRHLGIEAADLIQNIAAAMRSGGVHQCPSVMGWRPRAARSDTPDTRA
jgi:hypothetical protein